MDLSLDALLQEAAETLYNFQFQAGRQHQLSRNGAGDRAHADGLADYELTCNLPSQVRAALRRADGANPPRIVPPVGGGGARDDAYAIAGALFDYVQAPANRARLSRDFAEHAVGTKRAGQDRAALW